MLSPLHLQLALSFFVLLGVPASCAPPKPSMSVWDELYTLATNFLLYVLLIIVMVLLKRFYYDTDFGTDEDDDYVPVVDTMYGDTMIEMTEVEGEKSFKGKKEETLLELEEEEEEEEEGHAGQHHEKKDEDDELVHMEIGEGASVPLSSIQRNVSFLDFQNLDDKQVSRKEVWQKLGLFTFGLIGTFLVWSVLQERMLTREYGNGEYFTYSYGLVFTSRLGGLVLSTALMKFYKVPWAPPGKLYEFALPSVSNMLSSWCQYEALKFVSFPTQMLSKSFKIMPIMLMGSFLGNKKYDFFEYAVALMIGLGNTIFLLSSENLGLGEDSYGREEGWTGAKVGLVLLGFYLFCDSFTSQWQAHMFSTHPTMSPIQMMFLINCFSTVFSLVTLVHTNELMPFLAFVTTHSEIHLHLILFALSSTVGHLLIYYTIRNFGAVVFAIISTIRILLSIILSNVLYAHPITEMGVVGMIIVFGAAFYRIKRKTEAHPLFTWLGGLDPQQGIALFHELHEHLDL